MTSKKKFSESDIFKNLFQRYPELGVCKSDIQSAFDLLREAFIAGNKLIAAGNGGSAADCEHIVGELMKSFRFPRKIPEAEGAKLRELYGEDGDELAQRLEGSLPAIALPSMTSLLTASINDNAPKLVYAQMVQGYGQYGDVFLAISTSGNSENIVLACMEAKVKGLKVIGLTGGTGGQIKSLCDVNICVPSSETFEIQEYHLPVYHALCAMLEASFFECKQVK